MKDKDENLEVVGSNQGIYLNYERMGKKKQSDAAEEEEMIRVDSYPEKEIIEEESDDEDEESIITHMVIIFSCFFILSLQSELIIDVCKPLISHPLDQVHTP